MLWFRVLPFLFLLSACGFQSVYGAGGNGGILQDRVLVEEQNTREGFLLVRQIEERIGRGADPAYRLGLGLEILEEGLGVDEDDNTLRFNLIGTADFELRDETGALVTSGQVSSFTGYSATGTFVATLAAEQDARERLMTILADQIIARLLTADL